MRSSTQSKINSRHNKEVEEVEEVVKGGEIMVDVGIGVAGAEEAVAVEAEEDVEVESMSVR